MHVSTFFEITFLLSKPTPYKPLKIVKAYEEIGHFGEIVGENLGQLGHMIVQG